MPRVILHVDLDAFYASVEEREDPALKGEAVVVCMFSARGGDSGAVAACNYSARELGIRSGMPISQAKKLGSHALYLPARRGFYSEVSENVMALLRSHADSFEQVSIDEAFLDVSDKTSGDFQKGVSIAEMIKQEIREKEGLTCSVGVGPNKLIAKMASDLEKPDGLTAIRPENVDGFLRPLPVSKLWGVGDKTEEALGGIGVKKVGELLDIELPRLIGMFGRARGSWLYNAARGVDDEPVKERGAREQIGRITTLEEDTHDVGTIKKTLESLAGEVNKRVRERGDHYRTITVYAVTRDLKGHTRSRTLPFPTNDRDMMMKVAGELVESFLEEQDKPIRRAGIRVSNFSKPLGQKSLSDF